MRFVQRDKTRDIEIKTNLNCTISDLDTNVSVPFTDINAIIL